MESAATVTELDLAEVERALAVVEERLGEEIARPLRLLLVWSRTVLGLLERKNLSLKRLRRMFVGKARSRWKPRWRVFPGLAWLASIGSVRYGVLRRRTGSVCGPLAVGTVDPASVGNLPGCGGAPRRGRDRSARGRV